jgi:hypothetical protein
MKHTVIRPFIDKKSGNRIEPGDPLPRGMTDDRLRRLIRIGCVEGPVPREKADSKSAGGGGKTGQPDKPADGSGGQGPRGSAAELFPDRGAPMAGGAGDADRGGTEPEPGGRGEGSGEHEGHSG